MHQSASASFNIPIRHLVAVAATAITLLLSACASYDGRLNSTSTQYLGTDGSIVTKTSTHRLPIGFRIGRGNPPAALPV